MTKVIESLRHNSQSDYSTGHIHRYHRSKGGEQKKSSTDEARRIMSNARWRNLVTLTDPQTGRSIYLDHPLAHRNRVTVHPGVPRRARDYFR